MSSLAMTTGLPGLDVHFGNAARGSLLIASADGLMAETLTARIAGMARVDT